MIIIGAGLSGLLCGALNPGSVIYEKNPENTVVNHKAIMRLRSQELSRLTVIPLKEVVVHKAIWFDGKEVEPTPRIAHMYSAKVMDTISARSIFDIKPCIRFIPPNNLSELLKKRCSIKYDFEYQALDGSLLNKNIISTIPMPLLNKILGSSIEAIFQTTPIYINHLKISNCDSYCTIYYPDPDFPIYRASLNGNILIIEGFDKLCEADIESIFISLGIDEDSWHSTTVSDHKQRYGKIKPIDNKIRQQFISSTTLNHNIYSLGRFATWRPKVMVDDVIEDIFVIRRLISEGNYGSISHKQSNK